MTVEHRGTHEIEQLMVKSTDGEEFALSTDYDLVLLYSKNDDDDGDANIAVVSPSQIPREEAIAILRGVAEAMQNRDIDSGGATEVGGAE